MDAYRRTAVQFNINTKEIAQIRVPVPPLVRQQVFATRVQQCSELAAQQSVATAAAQDVFERLMSEVFSQGSG